MRIAACLQAHSLATPRKVAVTEGDRRLDFETLEHSSNAVAWGLRERGFVPGQRIAVCMENSLEFAVALAGAIKAGASCVMLNPRLTRAEIEYMLDDSAPSAVLFQAATRELVRGHAAVESALRVVADRAAEGEIAMADLALAGQRTASKAPNVPPAFDDCIICYTSGTTGRPKGAIVTQSNVVLVASFVNTVFFGLQPDDVQLVTTPLAHRWGLGRLMNTFCVGCSTVLLPRFEIASALDAIQREKVTLLGVVPTVARMLLPEMQVDPGRFASVRAMIAGGEAFPVELKQKMLAAVPFIGLYTCFALTEVSPFTCLPPAEQLTHPASVGRVIPGAEVRLQDERGQEVAAGEVGEICVRSGEPGRFLTMAGYFNRPEETAATIRDGWVATGDMGRFDEAGYLYIMDRKKDMVVSGGYNVYCKEVEACLCEMEAVLDAAVFGVPDDLYGEAVAACIEVRPGHALDAETVLAHCRERIAGYKRPRHVRFVEQLPRNSTGKVVKSRVRDGFR